MKAKEIIKFVLRLAGVCGIISLIWTWKTYGSFVMAANSVKQLNEHFYYMEFKGNTQLKEFMERGGAENNSQLGTYIEFLLRGKQIKKVYKEQVPLNTGCAAIGASTTDGKELMGRNYDWDDLKNAVIIKSTPKNGYKSISTVQFDFVGFGKDFKPDSFGRKYLMSAGLFVPLDGMNEKGLVISDLMAGDDEVTDQDNGKNDVTTTLAIRCILDFCADVPEAIEFLKSHDMHSVIGKAHHFAIRDAAGRMIVVEYSNNEMIITEAQAVTNHYLGVEKDLSTRQNSVYRLGVLNDYLESNKNNMTENTVKSALYDIRASQFGSDLTDTDKTWWRIVFNQTDLTVNYALEENYADDAAYIFRF